MRGGYLHNTILLDPIEALFRQADAQTRREYPVQNVTTRGAIDLVATWNGNLVAVEAERKAERTAHDVQKARAAGADLLVIVVPNRRIASAVMRHLNENEVLTDCDVPVWVLAVRSCRRTTSTFFSIVFQPESRNGKKVPPLEIDAMRVRWNRVFACLGVLGLIVFALVHWAGHRGVPGTSSGCAGVVLRYFLEILSMKYDMDVDTRKPTPLFGCTAGRHNRSMDRDPVLGPAGARTH